MDPGFRSPLLDLFQRGDVAREVRMLAARGALAPRAHEQLALLIGLVGDRDEEVRATAEATIAAVPRAALEAFLARPDAAASIREFFAGRGIGPAAVPGADAEADAPLIDLDQDEGGTAESGDAAAEETKQGTVEKLAAMTIAERMKVAMKGTREQRAILIRDPNKLVSSAVLSSPKINDSEIESFAKMGSVSEEVLRVIGRNRSWLKNYGVASALARNPKTPPAVSMHLVQRLNDRDLKMIALDRNAPESLRVLVRKRLSKGKLD